jgi:hypothetical protein
MKPEYLEPIKKDLLKRIRELESRAKSFHTRTQWMEEEETKQQKKPHRPNVYRWGVLRPVGYLAPIPRERSLLGKPLIASLRHFDWSPAMNIPLNGRTKKKRLNKKTAPKRGSQGLVVETL